MVSSYHNQPPDATENYASGWDSPTSDAELAGYARRRIDMVDGCRRRALALLRAGYDGWHTQRAMEAINLGMRERLHMDEIYRAVGHACVELNIYNYAINRLAAGDDRAAVREAIECRERLHAHRISTEQLDRIMQAACSRFDKNTQADAES